MNFNPRTPLFTDDEWRKLRAHLNIPDRQADVLWQLLSGSSDSRIADLLGIAKPTVRAHFRRLFQHFEVQDRTELVIEVVKVFRQSLECRCRDSTPFDDRT